MRMPSMCYGYIPGAAEAVTAIDYGELGYFKTGHMGGRETAIGLNSTLDVNIQQMEAMVAGSMFGFSCTAANPDMYDEDGNMKSN